MQNLVEDHHANAVNYFVDKAYIPFFKLEWQGPGVARQEIPRTALRHAAKLPLPHVALTTTGGTDGTATIKAQVDAQGHEIASVRLFPGKLQIAESYFTGFCGGLVSDS